LTLASRQIILPQSHEPTGSLAKGRLMKKVSCCFGITHGRSNYGTDTLGAKETILHEVISIYPIPRAQGSR